MIEIHLSLTDLQAVIILGVLRGALKGHPDKDLQQAFGMYASQVEYQLIEAGYPKGAARLITKGRDRDER